MGWHVKICPINVNAGDSTLILVYLKEKFGQDDQDRAVLIDGGVQAAAISRVLPYLQKLLKKPRKHPHAARDYYKLHTIIVTHYDQDHVNGITWLLENKQFQECFLDNTCIYDLGLFRGEGSKAPYRNYGDSIGRAAKSIIHFTSREPFIKRLKELGESKPENREDTRLLGYEFLWADILIDEDQSKDDLIQYFNEETIVAKEKIQVGYLLQANLKDLYYNNSAAKGKPALFCIAVNQAVLQPKPQSTTHSLVVGPPDPTTVRNKRSIALILTYTPESIIYYTGGDISDTQEGDRDDRGIAFWLKAQRQAIFGNDDEAKNKHKSFIPALKFSHHGSRWCTPPSLIKVCQPSLGVVSAGTRHGHPHIELIIYLYGYNHSRHAKHIPISIGTLNYPYYLIGYENENSKLKKGLLGEFLKDRYPDPTYKAQILTELKANNCIADVVDDIAMLNKENGGKKIEYYWGKISYLLDKRCRSIKTDDQQPSVGMLELVYFPNKNEFGYGLRGYFDSVSEKKRFRIDTALNTETTVFEMAEKPISISFNKRKLAPFVKTLDSNSSFTLGANSLKDGSTAVSPPLLLTADCALNKFVESVHEKCLQFASYQIQDADSNQWTITGGLAGELEHWFAQFGIVEIQVTVIGKKEDYLAVEEAGVTITANIDQTKYSSLPLIPLAGYLLPKGKLGFKLSNSPSNSITRSIIDNGKFIGYLEAIGDNLGATTTAALNGLFQNKLDELKVPLDAEQTLIVFKPKKSYTMRLQLVSRPPDFNIDNKLAFNNSHIGFCSQSHLLNPLWLSQGFSFFLDTQVRIGDRFTSDVMVNIYPDGQGKFAFAPEENLEGNIAQVINEFINILFPNSPNSDSSFKFLDTIGEFKVIEQVNVEFTLNPPSIDSVEFTSRFSFKVKDGLSFNLRTYLLFPDFSLRGNLEVEESHVVTPSLPSSEPVVSNDATSEDDNEDDNEEEDKEQPVKSTVSLGQWCDHQHILRPHDNIAKFPLANIYFAAQPRSKYYNIEALLIGDYAFNDYISFKKMAMKFTRDQDIDICEASLEGTINSIQSNGVILLQAAYSDSEWQFKADISNLPLSDVLALFPKQVGSELEKKLPEIVFDEASLNFNMTAGTFSLHGKLQIASVLFQIDGNINSESKTISASWSSTSDVAPTLKDMIESLDLGLSWPSEIDVTLKEASFTYSFTTSVMKMALTTANGKAELLIFKGKNDSVKKVLSLDYDLPPQITGIPVVGSLPTPVQKLQLTALSDDMDENDIATLNSQLNSADLHLAVDPENKEMRAGIALFLTLPSVSKPVVLNLTSPGSATRETEGAAIIPRWIHVSCSLGPLFLNRIGLSFAEQKLWLFLDGGVSLGGVMLQAQGLGFGIDLSKLQKGNFPLEKEAIRLNGLGLGYHTNFLTIEGDLLRDIPALTNTEYSYSGAAVIGAGGFNLAGVGSYAKLNTGAPALFLFSWAESQKGFGGPPYFYIKGFAGGFGYNWKLRLPKQEEVLNFPLLPSSQTSTGIGTAEQDPLQTALALLQALKAEGPSGKPAWLTPQVGEYWLAAGLTFSTFELVTTKALAVATLGEELQLSLLGRSTMQLPQVGPTLVYAELGVNAVFKPASGYFGLSATLSPNTYLFHPDCHLSGGFIFNTWFAGDRAGDFVVSLGGYHPAIKTIGSNSETEDNTDGKTKDDTLYPAVPRVRLAWQVSSELAFSGEGYFAVTPSCMMAGGKLHAAYHDGDLKAWFDANADFLMNWQPFYSEIDVHVNAGVSYRLSTGFSSKPIKAEVGADLNLSLPPLAGKAHISWEAISFTVKFGKNKEPAPLIKWSDFKKSLPRREDADALDVCKIIPTSGLVRQYTKDNTSYWVVRASEFACETFSAIPVTDVEVSVNKFKPADFPKKDSTDLFLKPVQESPIKSRHEVVITTPTPNSVEEKTWEFSVAQRKVPDALWGKPRLDKRGRSKPALPDKDSLLDKMSGVTIKAPPTILGSCLGPISMETLWKNKAIDGKGVVQFKSPVEPDPVPSSTPESALKALRDNIPTSLIKRRDVASYLQRYGFLAQAPLPDTVENLSMKRFAAEADIEFREPPLIRQ